MNFPIPEFFLGGRSGDDALNGGERGVLTAVEGFEAFRDEGGVVGKGLSHYMGCWKRKYCETLTRTCHVSNTMYLELIEGKILYFVDHRLPIYIQDNP